jgi:hypothetical protein
VPSIARHRLYDSPVQPSIRSAGIWLLLLAAVTACSGDGADPPPTTATAAETVTTSATTVGPTATTTLPSDLEIYDGDGFSVLLPAGWTILDADDVSVDQLLEDVADMLEAGMVDAIGAMFEQGGRIIAFDFENADPSFVTNINILEAPLPPFPIETVESVTAEQLQSVLGATIVDSGIRTTAAGEVVIVRYSSPETDTEGISATLLTESTQWAITLSARSVAPFATRFDAIVDSFTESR